MFNFTDVLFFSATFLALTMLTRALRKKSTNRKYPPSLPSLPIVGSLPFIRNLSNVHEFFMRKVDQLGPIFTFKAGSRLILILNSKEVIEEALVKNSTCFAGREMFYFEQVSNRGQKGIVSKNFSDEFKRYHKLSLSVLREFGFGTNRLMETRIQQEFEAMAAFIRTKQGIEFDPVDITDMASYNIIKNILFGKRDDYEKGADEIRKQLVRLVENVTAAIEFAPSLMLLFPYFRRRLDNCVGSLCRINEILEEEIEIIKKSGKIECFVSSYLAKVGLDYDHEQLIHTLRDLISAGSETTASTVLWLLVFIANNPSTRKRLQKEIDAVVERHRLPSLDDQPKLPFVEATILEILRLRAIAPLGVPHLTLSDSEVCGYFIPAGTTVFPNLHASNMDPKLWKDPDVFRPERFLDENYTGIISRDNVISFSLGRRSCLGEVLARQELFLFFAGLMQRFDIQPGKDGQTIDETPVADMITKPLPFKIRMIPREI